MVVLWGAGPASRMQHFFKSGLRRQNVGFNWVFVGFQFTFLV